MPQVKYQNRLKFKLAIRVASSLAETKQNKQTTTAKT